MAAISGTVQPAMAKRVTAVPRKSWKCRSSSRGPARSNAFPHDVLKPSVVHGSPKVLRRMAPSAFSGLRVSRATFSGAPTGITTRFFRFFLAQPDLGAVVLHPCEAYQIALALAGPERQHQRELQGVRRRGAETCGVVGAPDDVSAVRLIEMAAALAHVDGDQTPVFREWQDSEQHRPGVVGCAGPLRHRVAPRLELTPRASVIHRRKRHCTELILERPCSPSCDPKVATDNLDLGIDARARPDRQQSSS
jgi:hypothetical protein